MRVTLVFNGLSTGDSNQIQIENSLIKSILCEKLLGVKSDHKCGALRDLVLLVQF